MGKVSQYRRFRGFRSRVRDLYYIILDYMPNGNPFDRHLHHRSMPISQAVGTKYFTLVEILPPLNTQVKLMERMYIEPVYEKASGAQEAQQAYKLGEQLLWQDLTPIARDNLNKALREIIIEKEKVFVEFFNQASPINIRLHMLELLPGIGKKSLEAILSERRKRKFQSFKDVEERVRIQDPVKILVERIIAEMMGGEKYYLFVEPPPGDSGARFFKMLDYLYAYVNYRELW